MACMGENSTYNVLVSKHEGKRPLGMSRRRWEGNVTVVLKEIRMMCME